MSNSQATKGKESGPTQQKNEGDNNKVSLTQSESNPVNENSKKGIHEVNATDGATTEKKENDPNAPSSNMFDTAKEFLVAHVHDENKELPRSDQDEYPTVNSNPMVQAIQDLTG